MGDERYDLDVLRCMAGKTDPAPASFTIDTINQAMRKIWDDYGKAEAERADRTAAFLEAAPERMRRRPFVQVAASAVGVGAVFHPADARAIRAELDRLAALNPDALAADAAKLSADLQQRFSSGNA